MKTLTVISPVYNESEVIEHFYEELKSVLKTLSYRCKILFVLDRSTDGTFEILKKISEKDSSVQVLALSARFGHQMSLLAGIDNANSDVAIMMDSDLQHPPDLIPKMIDEYEKGKDIVYTIRKDTEKIKLSQKLLSKLYYLCINLVSEIHINESAADFRLISSKILDILKTQIRERNIFLRGIISWIGFDQTGLPFQAKKRHAGRSKYSLSHRVRLGAHGVFSFSKKPLQAAILLGSALAILGFGFGFFTFIQYFLKGTFPLGWATLITLLTGYSGMQLIFLGIVGQYISGIFDEVKGRPHYIVKEKLNF